jgi:polyhydroxybutyrate depolymerase
MTSLRVKSSVLAAALLTVLACKSSSSSPGDNPTNSFGGTSGGHSSSSGTGSPTGTATTTAPPAPTSVVDVTTQTMTFGGQPRTYLLAKPKSYDASKSYPLVVAFHGNPSTAKVQADAMPFDSASGSDAVIAYPQAASADGDGFSWDLYTPHASNADMDFIAALPDEIKKTVNIDKARVYGFGYSGGGFFLPQFVCVIGGVFKAISVNAGGGPDQEPFTKRANGCYVCPAGPVPAIVTHGMNDTEVTVDSGQFTAACLASENGCGDTATATTPSPCELVDGCPANEPVKRCFIPGLGHGPWDGAMREAWVFWKSLP